MKFKPNDKQFLKIVNTSDIYSIVQKIILREYKIGNKRENFWTLGLERNYRFAYIELLNRDSLDNIMVQPKEIFSMALQKKTPNLILCHNHLNGDLTPSQQDLDITDRLIHVGNIMEIEIIEHLIISEKDYYSFSNNNLIEKLKHNSKYRLRGKSELY